MNEDSPSFLSPGKVSVKFLRFNIIHFNEAVAGLRDDIGRMACPVPVRNSSDSLEYQRGHYGTITGSCFRGTTPRSKTALYIERVGTHRKAEAVRRCPSVRRSRAPEAS